MKPKYALAILTAAIAVFVQSALTEFTQNKNGEITHVNGIQYKFTETIPEALDAPMEITVTKNWNTNWIQNTCE